MLIIALVLAAIGLAALVFAVVTSNALVAWVCIGASLLGVLLLIVDALRERRRNGAPAAPEAVEPATESDDDTAEDTDGADDGAGDDAEASDAEAADEQESGQDVDDEPAEESDDEPAAHPAD